MKYKISEVSKILNIPVDTLRYFEKQGIISPCIDAKNNYRYYDAWDINYLLEYKLYRALEFSMSDSMDIQKSDDLAAFTQRLSKQQEYFNARKVYYSHLEENNQERIDSINSIPCHLNKISIRQMEEMDYFIHRHNYKYDMADQTDGLFTDWMEHYPFIRALVRITRKDLQENNNNYEWGFAAAPRWVNIMQLKKNEFIRRLSPCNAVYTVVKSGGKGTFSHSLLDQALDYIERERLDIKGDIIGYILTRTHEKAGYSRYIEFYIPI